MKTYFGQEQPIYLSVVTHQKKIRLELRYSQFFSMGRVKFLFLRFSAFLGRQVCFWHFLMRLFLYWSGNTLNLWESLHPLNTACKLDNRGDKDIKKLHFDVTKNLKLNVCKIIESFLFVYAEYGNTGCGSFKRGIKN